MNNKFRRLIFNRILQEQQNIMKVDYVIKNIKTLSYDKQLELFYALIAELACT